MNQIIHILNSPELVVKFQRYCGILPAKSSQRKEADKESNTTPPSSDSTSQTQNGSAFTDNLHKRQSVQKQNSASSSSSDENDEKDFVVTNKILDFLFHFGAGMGNELFYITFYPFWLWNVDGYVGRRICVFWCIFMYLGQAAKDIIRWPRPSSPPVFQLEKRYALEYGFPSTHAMVGAGMPFGLLILTMQRYIYPFEYFLVGAICWCLLVSFSRLYLGMHSILDVLAGLAFVFILGLVIFPFLDSIDYFLLHSPYSPAVSVLVPLTLCLCYPTLDKWSTARGDTTLIMAVGGGLFLGHWVCFQYGLMQKATTPPPYHIIPPSFLWLGQMALRLAIGIVILFSTRAVMKMLSCNLVCYILGISKEDRKSHQRLIVELPYKFITYFTIAFNAVYLAPQVFRYLGIERPTFFTEI